MPNDFYNISDLNIKERAESFVLFVRDIPLLTPEKNEITSSNRGLIEFIIQDFKELRVERFEVSDGVLIEPRVLSVFQLYASQVDYIAPGAGPTLEEYHQWLSEDPVLADVPPAGVCGPVERYLVSLGLALVPQSSPGGQRLLNNLVDICRSLTPEKQSVVVNLSQKFHMNVLFPMALVDGFCSTDDFAVGISASVDEYRAFFDPSSGADQLPALADITNLIKAVRGDADACLKYLKFYS